MNAQALTAPSLRETELRTWDERDRYHIELRDKRNDRTIVEWWDGAATQAIDDGFLSHKGGPALHASAYSYAEENDLLVGTEDGPSFKEDPEEEEDDEPERIEDETIEWYLGNAIDEAEKAIPDTDCRSIGLESYSTFEDAEILTSDRGLVLRLSDGSAWQITIRRSKSQR